MSARFIKLAVLLLVLVSGAAVGAAAQDATPAPDATPVATGEAGAIEWTRYDVVIDLRPDGVLHVTERQEVAFQGGPFSFGFADIPLRNVDRIDQILVGEEASDGQIATYAFVAADAYDRTPETYTVRSDGNVAQVDWAFAPVSDATRTFVLAFDVHGALRSGTVDETAYAEVWWTAIDADVTDAGPILAATAALRLPAAPDPTLVLVSPVGYVPSTSGDWSVWTWERTPLPPGEGLTVRLRFPASVLPAPGATPAATPASIGHPAGGF